MKKLLPTFFSLTVLTASAQAPEGMLADVTHAPAPTAGATPTDAPAILELVSFEAYVSGPEEKVQLRWATASERAHERFIIERSSDLEAWSPVMALDGEGHAAAYTRYEVEDPGPLEGVSYYRLRNLENGMSVELSDLFSVRRSSSQLLQILPDRSPGHFTVEADGPMTDVLLMDNRGQFIPMTLDIRDDRVLVNAELLAPGTYYVQAVVNGSPVQRPVIITGTTVIGG
ncbi:MAG: hypothetical protein JST66_02170 [Bacteroidetes bacterium]|nr:hypothetical protein [Bacteroidota bacterium]